MKKIYHNLSKFERGAISIGLVITGATILGSVFAWTYSQFGAVNARASVTEVNVATVTQKVNDVDGRLTRIEDKLDILIRQNK